MTDLSPGQLDVLRLCADGLTDRAICTRLRLGIAAVKYRKRGLFAALGASNITHAVALAYRTRILLPDDLALVRQEETTPTVHVTAAEFATERFWAEHVDPVAREHGIEARGLNLDPGDPAQYLLKDDDGRLLLVVRTDREDA
jgi:DNA-binding CsgD family transcriptional regulator